MVPEQNDNEHGVADGILRHLSAPATRRTFVLGTLAFLAGCSTTGGGDRLPGIVWNDPITPSRGGDSPSRQPAAVRTGAIPRSSWAKGNCIPSNMNRMRPVQRITIHHDGMDAFTSTSQSAASAPGESGSAANSPGRVHTSRTRIPATSAFSSWATTIGRRSPRRSRRRFSPSSRVRWANTGCLQHGCIRIRNSPPRPVRAEVCSRSWFQAAPIADSVDLLDSHGTVQLSNAS